MPTANVDALSTTTNDSNDSAIKNRAQESATRSPELMCIDDLIAQLRLAIQAIENDRARLRLEVREVTMRARTRETAPKILRPPIYEYD
jgi:hypothetical protein